MPDDSESSTSDPSPEAQATEPGPAPPSAEPASAATGWRSRLPLLSIPLSRLQLVVGLTAGLLSISGFLYPALRASRAPLPLGEVVTVVHEAASRRPVTDATVEILTPHHVLVTTLTPRDEGRARHVIKEGVYRVRVTHPRFALEMRSIQVLAGTIAEVRFHLSPRRSPPAASHSAAPAAIRVQAPATPAPPAAPHAAAPASRPVPAAVMGPPRPPSTAEPAPAQQPREASGVRRTILRDQQSP